MVQIQQEKHLRPRFRAWDEARAFSSTWSGRFGREGLRAEIDGDLYEFRRDGRKRFVLSAGERELAVAEQEGRVWIVRAGGNDYELRGGKGWRRRMELCIPAGAFGEVRRQRRGAQCDLPPDLSPVVQAFIGFVALALWRRQAAASAGATASTAGAG